MLKVITAIITALGMLSHNNISIIQPHKENICTTLQKTIYAQSRYLEESIYWSSEQNIKETKESLTSFQQAQCYENSSLHKKDKLLLRNLDEQLKTTK